MKNISCYYVQMSCRTLSEYSLVFAIFRLTSRRQNHSLLQQACHDQRPVNIFGALRFSPSCIGIRVFVAQASPVSAGEDISEPILLWMRVALPCGERRMRSYRIGGSSLEQRWVLSCAWKIPLDPELAVTTLR